MADEKTYTEAEYRAVALTAQKLSEDLRELLHKNMALEDLLKEKDAAIEALKSKISSQG